MTSSRLKDRCNEIFAEAKTASELHGILNSILLYGKERIAEMEAAVRKAKKPATDAAKRAREARYERYVDEHLVVGDRVKITGSKNEGFRRVLRIDHEKKRFEGRKMQWDYYYKTYIDGDYITWHDFAKVIWHSADGKNWVEIKDVTKE